MATRLILLAVVLIATIAAGGVLTASLAGAQTACEQSVRHEFKDADAVDAINNTGTATSRMRNTVVTIEEATGFLRVTADNPNGYCVAFDVEVTPEIVAAADLGTIDSNDGEREATWRAAQNLTSGDVHTRVEFSLGAGESATFAPSTVRVKSLSWTGNAKQTGGSIVSRVTEFWSSRELEQRKYTIAPTESADAVTVPLEDGDRAVSEWIASYRVGDRSGVTVGQDASAPVYFTESGDAVTFHFNDKDASVTFIAEPSIVDRFSHSAHSYTAGITDVGSWLPLATGGIAS